MIRILFKKRHVHERFLCYWLMYSRLNLSFIHLAPRRFREKKIDICNPFWDLFSSIYIHLRKFSFWYRWTLSTSTFWRVWTLFPLNVSAFFKNLKPFAILSYLFVDILTNLNVLNEGLSLKTGFLGKRLILDFLGKRGKIRFF